MSENLTGMLYNLKQIELNNQPIKVAHPGVFYGGRNSPNKNAIYMG